MVQNNNVYVHIACAPNLDQLFYIDDIFILNMNNFVYNKICITALSSSFLFQSKKCMIPKNGYLEGRTCNVNNSNQRWIWTPNNQLMHVDTLKCLQQGKRLVKSQYWFLGLQECNSNETKQFWKCQGQTFSLKNYDTINLYIINRAWGTTLKIKQALSRYSSGKYLCSKGIVELFFLLLCCNIELR